jgi:hypothetical protein
LTIGRVVFYSEKNLVSVRLGADDGKWWFTNREEEFVVAEKPKKPSEPGKSSGLPENIRTSARALREGKISPQPNVNRPQAAQVPTSAKPPVQTPAPAQKPPVPPTQLKPKAQAPQPKPPPAASAVRPKSARMRVEQPALLTPATHVENEDGADVPLEPAKPRQTTRKTLGVAQTKRSSRVSRAGEGGGRRSQRQPHPPVMPMMMIAAIAAVVILAAVVVFGYRPYVQHGLLKQLDEGSPEEQKTAAYELHRRWPEDMTSQIASRLRSAQNEGVLRACAEVWKKRVTETKNAKLREKRVEATAEILQKCAEPAKLILLETMVFDERDTVLAPLLLKTLSEKTEAECPLRLAALKTLVAMPAEGVCVELLKIAADAKHPREREIALSGIAPTARAEAAEKLLTAMDAADEELAKAATAGFQRVRSEAPSSVLRPLLKHAKASIRRAALDVLADRTTDPIAAQGLIECLTDAEPDLRAKAAETLDKLKLTQAQCEAAARMGLDQEPAVRLAAATALSKRGDEATFGALKNVIAEVADSTFPAELVRAWGAVGKIRGANRSRKDLPALLLAMKLLNAAAGTAGEATARETLAKLSVVGGQPKRESERARWTTENWKTWFSAWEAREKKSAEAGKLLDEAQAFMDNKEQSHKIPEAVAVKWIALLESASDAVSEMSDKCRATDAEDADYYDRLNLNLNMKLQHFRRFWTMSPKK